jgi:uncharacterized caspase-like protein
MANNPTPTSLVSVVLVIFALACFKPSESVRAAESSIAPKRVALIIGNSNYLVAPLNNPVNDARGMAKALRALGFDVKAYENLDATAMRRAVAEFGERLTEGGVALFFYSGHGIQLNGKNYLVPTNADIKSERYISAETVELNSVLTQMDEAKSTMNIVLLDACRDNPFARQFRSATRGLAFMDAPVGSFIAYATSPGSVARDGDPGGYGVWTGELLKTISQPGLKIEEVLKRARQAVLTKTNGRQSPWDASSLTGELYFSVTSNSKMALRW